MDVSEGGVGVTGYLAFDENEIEDMRTAVTTYQENINTCIKAISEYALSGTDGIYGSDQIANVSAYIDGTCAAINAIVIMFDEFKEKLDQVQQAYNAKQRGINPGEVAEAAAASESDLVTVTGFEDGAGTGASGSNVGPSTTQASR